MMVMDIRRHPINVALESRSRGAMRELIERAIPALVLSIGIAAGAYAIGGRYTFSTVHDESGFVAWRFDRLTGKMNVCILGGEKEVSAICVSMPEPSEGMVTITNKNLKGAEPAWEQFGKPTDAPPTQ